MAVISKPSWTIIEVQTHIDSDDQHGDPMRPDNHSRNMETGFFSPFGWRRDSERRLPLRQIGPSLHPGGAYLLSE